MVCASLEVEIDTRLPPATLHNLLQACRASAEFPAMGRCANTHPTFLINHPRLIEQVLAANHKNISRGFSADRVALILGEGLLVSEGEVWRKQRQTLHAMFRKEALALPGALVADRAARLVTRLQALAEAEHAVDLNKEMLSYSLELNLCLLFGDDADLLLASDRAPLFATLTEEPTGSTRENLQFLKEVSDLRSWLFELIEQRRSGGPVGEDLLQNLLSARSRRDNLPMSDARVVDELVNFLTAGHATVASGLTHSFATLARQPAAVEAIREEVERVCGSQVPSYGHLSDLVRTRQIVQECLRLEPPIWILTRRTQTTIMLDDTVIPEGANLVICPYLVHRQPDVWPNPEHFDFTRFEPDPARARSRFAYIPFSAGPRSCIGDQLSLMDLTLTLAILYQSLDLTIVQLPLQYEPGFLLRSKTRLDTTIKKRHVTRP